MKFYTSLSKELKLKVREFWGLIPTFEVTGEKLVGGGLFAPPILNRVNDTHRGNTLTKSMNMDIWVIGTSN